MHYLLPYFLNNFSLINKNVLLQFMNPLYVTFKDTCQIHVNTQKVNIWRLHYDHVSQLIKLFHQHIIYFQNMTNVSYYNLAALIFMVSALCLACIFRILQYSSARPRSIQSARIAVAVHAPKSRKLPLSIDDIVQTSYKNV